MENTKTIKGRISHKHGTEADWYAAGTAANPFIPLPGELIIYDPDAIYGTRTKYGDGALPVHLLPWASGCDETIGFIFEDNGDDTYSIIGHYDANDDWTTSAVWIIPRGFCGCPVRRIDYTGFVDGITDVFIPNSIEEISTFGISPISIERIYCEATSQPEGWDSNWMPDQYDEIKATVIWDATRDILALNEKINNLVTLDKIAYIDEWYNERRLDECSEDGIAWSEEFAFLDSNDGLLKSGDLYQRVPIVAGNNVEFEVDEENQVVKINATGGNPIEDGLVGPWVFNDVLTAFETNEYITFNCVFKSYDEWNFGVDYTSFSFDAQNPLFCFGRPGPGAEVYSFEDDTWFDERYKTIQIIEAPTDPEFITWLKANAIKQKENLNTESKTIIGAINELHSEIGDISTALENIINQTNAILGNQSNNVGGGNSQNGGGND